MEIPFVGPSYNLETRPSGVQRTINMVPVPQESGNERTTWVFKDVPGLVTFNPPVSSGGDAPAIGWLDLVTDAFGTAAHANAGVAQYKFGIEPIIINESMYAGVVGYIGGATSWSSVWTPLGTDTAPTLTDLGGGIVEVHWPDLGGFPNHSSEGLLVVNCTVDGVPVGATIEVTSSNSFYTNFAWGPSP